MYIHASRGWEYGYAQQAAEANGPGQGHPAGETLQPAYRKDLLLLDTLLHSLPRGPTSRRHGRRGGTRLPGTFGGGAPGGGGHAESGVECARILYRHVLDQPLGDIGEFSRAKRPRRLPVVLSHEDVMRVLSKINQHSRATAQHYRGQPSA